MGQKQPQRPGRVGAQGGPLIDNHFAVSARDNVWLYGHKGDGAGPFQTRDEAIEAAISEAIQTGDIAAEAVVLDHDMQQESVCGGFRGNDARLTAGNSHP